MKEYTLPRPYPAILPWGCAWIGDGYAPVYPSESHVEKEIGCNPMLTMREAYAHAAQRMYDDNRIEFDERFQSLLDN